MKELMLNEEVRMTSLEVVDMINKFRLEEGNNKLIMHKNLMASIRNEIKVLESVGITNGLNFKLVEYIDTKGEKTSMLLIR